LAKNGIFDDEFASGTVAKIGNDLYWFNPVPRSGARQDQTRRIAAAINVAVELTVLLDHDFCSRSRTT
jgi:hypothetical protein